MRNLGIEWDGEGWMIKGSPNGYFATYVVGDISFSNDDTPLVKFRDWRCDMYSLIDLVDLLEFHEFEEERREEEEVDELMTGPTGFVNDNNVVENPFDELQSGQTGFVN